MGIICSVAVLVALSAGASEKASFTEAKHGKSVQVADRKLLLNTYSAFAEEHFAK